MSDPINIPAIVGEQVAGRSAKVRKQLESLNLLLVGSTFDVAELLAEVKAGNYYGDWGYQSFQDYVETMMDMKLSKARYLVTIINTSKKLNIPRTDYESIKITKLREIFSLRPFDEDGNVAFGIATKLPIAEHIKELLGKAKSMSLKEVVSEVSRINGHVGDDELVFIPAIKVTKSCRDNVILPAREMARNKLGSMAKDAEGDAQEYSDSACEEIIHADFLSDPNNVDQPTMEEALEDQDYSPEPIDEEVVDSPEPIEGTDIPSTDLEIKI